MAITTFIPKLWAARLLDHLDKAHVATAFVNRNYEGEIRRMGDTVHIDTLTDLTIGTYTANTDMSAPETLATTDQTLVINQAKYFNFQVDDIDRVQAAGPLMDAAMQRAAYGLADVVDQFIFNTIDAAVPSGNKIGTLASPTQISTPAGAYAQLVALRTIMAKNNVPSGTWQVAVPPEFMALLLQDDRFVKAGTDVQNAILQNGFVGRAAGFDIYESNNVPVGVSGTGSDAVNSLKVIAAPAFATTFAEQIVETEAYRLEARFADGVKGLDVYGAKNTHAAALAELIFQVNP